MDQLKTIALCEKLNLPHQYLERLTLQQSHCLLKLIECVPPSFNYVALHSLNSLQENFQIGPGAGGIGREIPLVTFENSLKKSNISFSSLSKEEQKLIMNSFSRNPASRLVDTSLFIHVLKYWHKLLKDGKTENINSPVLSSQNDKSPSKDAGSIIEVAVKFKALHPELIYFFELLRQRLKDYPDVVSLAKKSLSPNSFEQLLGAIGISINRYDFDKILRIIYLRGNEYEIDYNSQIVSIPLLMELSNMLCNYNDGPFIDLPKQGNFYEVVVNKIKDHQLLISQMLRQNSSNGMMSKLALDKALKQCGILLSYKDMVMIWEIIVERITGYRSDDRDVEVSLEDFNRLINGSHVRTEDFASLASLMRDNVQCKFRKSNSSAAGTVISDNINQNPITLSSAQEFNKKLFDRKAIPQTESVYADHIRGIMKPAEKEVSSVKCLSQVVYPWTQVQTVAAAGSNVKRHVTMRAAALSDENKTLLCKTLLKFELSREDLFCRSHINDALLMVGIKLAKSDYDDVWYELCQSAKGKPTPAFFLNWIGINPNEFTALSNSTNNDLNGTHISVPLQSYLNTSGAFNGPTNSINYSPARSVASNISGLSYPGSPSSASAMPFPYPDTVFSSSLSNHLPSYPQSPNRSLQSHHDPSRLGTSPQSVSDSSRRHQAQVQLEKNVKRSEAIRILQGKREDLTYLFKKSNSHYIRQVDSSISCVDLVNLLLDPPILLREILSYEETKQLVCDIAAIQSNSKFYSTRVLYPHIVKFLDDAVDFDPAAPQQQQPHKYRDLLLLESIKAKLRASRIIQGDRLKLLALTSQLRLRLRSALGRGHRVSSWEAVPDHCSMHEFKTICGTIDVVFSDEELTFIYDDMERANRAGYASGPTGLDNHQEKGFTVGATVMFLSQLLE